MGKSVGKVYNYLIVRVYVTPWGEHKRGSEMDSFFCCVLEGFDIIVKVFLGLIGICICALDGMISELGCSI